MLTKLRSSFILQVYFCALIVAFLCLILIALTWVQGPRVRSATFDISLITSAANQRLLLHMNQPPGVITDKQVRVTPEAPLAVTSSGNTVAIEFAQPLRSDTQYHLEVRTNDKRHTFNYDFRTPKASFYYVVDSKYNTEIYRDGTDAGTNEPVYSGRKVNDYLVAGDTLVLAAKDGNDNELLLYDIPTKRSKKVPLPGNGMISQLRSVPGKRLFGFLYTDYDNNVSGNVMLYDMNAGQLRSVESSHDRLVEAGSWRLARNATSVLVQTFDSSVLLLSPGVLPIPLGQYNEIFGFSYDDSAILMRHVQDGAVSLNIKNQEQKPLIAEKNTDTYVMEVLPLFTREGYIMRTQTSVNGDSAQTVFVKEHNGQKELYATSSLNEYITSINLSANDQLLTIEEHMTDSNTYRSLIINTDNGDIISTVEGSMVRWPSGL